MSKRMCVVTCLAAAITGCSGGVAPRTVQRSTESPPITATQSIQRNDAEPFTVSEMKTFMAAVAYADKIRDPMQRCLRYPDPPGSHWSRVGVEAYCHYRLQRIVNASDLVSLAQSGHAKDIDRNLNDLMVQAGDLRAQETFWRTIAEDCYDVTPDVRDAIEEWKRQTPDSAFAYAASGYCDVQMAWAARGVKSASDTPDARIDAMQALLDRAHMDLAKAISLNPKLTASYAAEINASVLTGDGQSAMDAARKGLAIDPSSFPIYDMLQLISEPRWGGSEQFERGLIASSMGRSAQNPLLLTIKAAVLTDVYDLRHCDCATVEERQAYREVFDQVTSTGILVNVAANALRNHQPELAYVYYSEALRFYPSDIAEDALNQRAIAADEISRAADANE